MNVQEFRKFPVIGILRGIDQSMVEPLGEIINACGLRYVEIAMNTPKAKDLIREFAKITGNNIVWGAGTVMTMEQLHQAIDAGATFIVMPILVKDVMEYCVKKSIPVFPGALTPTEIYIAWRAGATMVKVFPAKSLGPGYIKEIKGPFPEIELLACGGVSAENVNTFFKNKASAIAFGGSIFNIRKMQKGDYASIENELKDLLQQVKIIYC